MGRPCKQDKKQILSISLSPTMISWIDYRRGQESRSGFIRKAIRLTKADRTVARDDKKAVLLTLMNLVSNEERDLEMKEPSIFYLGLVEHYEGMKE